MSPVLQANEIIFPKLIALGGQKIPTQQNSNCTLTFSNNLLLYQGRIVIPTSLQHHTLTKIHHGHKDIDCILLPQYGGQE